MDLPGLNPFAVLPLVLTQADGSTTRRILLAEDNPINQKVTARMLEQLGHRADVAGNGQEAVYMAEAFSYALVLMDCEMPKMDGCEATREIRRREAASGRRVPIVAMTAHALSGARETCLEAGMDDHVAKPVKLDDLRRALARWLPAAGPAARAGDPQGGDPRSGEAAAAGHLDRRALAELRELEAESGEPFLADMIRKFLAAAPDALSRLRRACASGTHDVVASVAHSLQGTSGMLGALAVYALCREIQAIGRERRLDDAPGLLERLECEILEVRPELTAFLDELTGSFPTPPGSAAETGSP